MIHSSVGKHFIGRYAATLCFVFVLMLYVLSCIFVNCFWKIEFDLVSFCITADAGTKTYAHQMVRTDSREQKLDAFIKPTSQNRTDNESANQKSISTTTPNQTPASSANEQKLWSKESPMEVDDNGATTKR